MTKTKKLDTTAPKSAMFTPPQLKLLSEDLAEKGLSEKDFERFIIICERTRLDPFTRQIYARAQNVSTGHGENVKWSKELVIITSIDGLRAAAESTGSYRGQVGPFWCGQDGKWSDVWMMDETYPLAAKVGIVREHFPEPVFGVARFEAYVQLIKKTVGGKTEHVPNHFWEKMPDVLTAKCAEANGLRRAFPQLLSGVYIEEEITDADEPGRKEAIAAASKQIGTSVETVTHTPPVETKAAATAPAAATTPAPAATTPATPAVDTPDSPKPEPKKGGRKPAAAKEPAKAPETTAAPAAATETKAASAPAAAATTAAPAVSEERNKVLNYRISQLKVERFKDKQLGELSEKDLQFIKDKWIDVNLERIKEDPAKKLEAEMVIAALAIIQAQPAT